MELLPYPVLLISGTDKSRFLVVVQLIHRLTNTKIRSAEQKSENGQILEFRQPLLIIERGGRYGTVNTVALLLLMHGDDEVTGSLCTPTRGPLSM